MTSIDSRRVVSFLRKLRFRRDSTHHHFWVFRCGGKKIAMTYIGHSRGKYKSLHDDLINAIGRQMHFATPADVLRAIGQRRYRVRHYVAHLEAVGAITKGQCNEYLT